MSRRKLNARTVGRVAVLLSFFVLAQISRAAEPVLRIMSIGDSITTGYTDEPIWSFPYTSSYRMGLYTRMTNVGYAIQFVGSSPEPWNGIAGIPKTVGEPNLVELDQDHHHGYGWLTAYTVRQKLAEWVEADKPHVILLMVGNIAIQLDWTLQRVKDDLEDLVKMVQANHPKVHLMVAQMTPFISYLPEVTAYNDWIRTVLTPKYAAQGMRITTVDQYSILLRPGGGVHQIDAELFAGGHHLRPIGYDRMAGVWFERVQQIFPRTPVSIVSMSSANGRLQATYAGAPNGIYELERVPELGGRWVKVGPAITADSNGRFTLNDPAAPAEHCFYRIADPYN